MHDVIVVGSGPAGVAAALGFSRQGVKPLILDVGIVGDRPGPTIAENFYDYRRRHDSFDLTIGDSFRILQNAVHADQAVPVKLVAPSMDFVTREAERLSPVEASRWSAIQSFAAGGLANAWGAGLYRFTDSDLNGFPIRAEQLRPYFDLLTHEIGISGAEDDLAPFFGDASSLQPPLRLSHNAARLYERYRERQRHLHSRGIFLGRPRLGVLTTAKDGRAPCDYRNLEFWVPDLPHIYTPLVTLRKLIQQGVVEYQKGRLVTSWNEEQGSVTVRAIDLEQDAATQYRCRRLVLAAGAINSAKIALASRKDFRARLPLLDNPALQIPMVFPRSIGRGLDKDAFGLTQLNLIWQSNPFGETLQGSILELTSPMRSEFFPKFPFCATSNLELIRYLLPAMMVLQLFFPSTVQGPARLGLREDGTLLIEGRENGISVAKARAITRHLATMGAWSHAALFVKVPTGQSIHYGGTLPMRRIPETPYECDADGRLHQTDRVYVADGAVFPVLPAKNHSFAIMANAMRVADLVSARVKIEP